MQDLSLDVFLGLRIREQAQALIARWVSTLREGSSVEVHEVLPESELLTEISGVLEWIADFVSDPDAPTVDAAAGEEVGRIAELRRRKGLDVHELLREYRILFELLRNIAEEAAGEYSGPADLRDSARVMGRLMDAMNLVGVATVRSYQLWRERYDRERLDLMEAYGQIASHELGNRLGAAETAIQVLVSQMPDDEDRRSHLYSLIRESVREGRRTIDDVAGLARPLSRETGNRVSLWLVVKESVRLAGKEADRKGISVSIEGEVPDVAVLGPPVRIALANLISNAIRYHQNGSDDRWVRVFTRRDGESETVEITVEDNGPGISDGSREQVFDYRNAGDEEGEGSIFGLAITREVIEGVGGSISLSEGAAGGARFTLRVPARDTISDRDDHGRERRRS